MKFLKLFLISILLSTLFYSCRKENHIEKYNVDIEKLKKLPDNFYAFRHGNLYIENKYYRVWFNKTLNGNVNNIFKIDDFQTNENTKAEIIKIYNIDTIKIKKDAQEFINLSRKFKFGHIEMNRNIKISFSFRDGLYEQYVKAMNDSVKNKYKNDEDFLLLENNWFENQSE